MQYKVIKNFIDLDDEDKHLYLKGDKYPRVGKVVPKRAEQLSGFNNGAGEPVIKEVEEKEG